MSVGPLHAIAQKPLNIFWPNFIETLPRLLASLGAIVFAVAQKVKVIDMKLFLHTFCSTSLKKIKDQLNLLIFGIHVLRIMVNH